MGSPNPDFGFRWAKIFQNLRQDFGWQAIYRAGRDSCRSPFLLEPVLTDYYAQVGW